ncbi:MAG: hypothetical protein EB829_04790 [Nitrosopumilus sp. H8]|nr:MAG: hypothetical protein EB829_04790 [Nitrosopumilus sp. H8]
MAQKASGYVLMALMMAVLITAAGAFAGSVPGTVDATTSAGSTGSTGEEDQEYYIQIESYNDMQNARVNELKVEFKGDIRDLLEHAGTEEYAAKSDELVAEYDEFFRIVIEHARTSTNSEVMSEQEILAAIDYIFYETIKDEKRKLAKESRATEAQGIGFLEMFGIPTADAACKATTPRFKQLQIDIDGGTYNGKTYNGGNGMYRVDSSHNSRTCATEYTLYFHDEDHPSGDLFYDAIRLVMFFRTHDIESFVIHSNNRIEFDYTWSSNNRYDCLEPLPDVAWLGDVAGCHATTTKSYIPGQTIYVSNTWNHMMDTSDTNRSLPSVTVR